MRIKTKTKNWKFCLKIKIINGQTQSTDTQQLRECTERNEGRDESNVGLEDSIGSNVKLGPYWGAEENGKGFALQNSGFTFDKRISTKRKKEII